MSEWRSENVTWPVGERYCVWPSMSWYTLTASMNSSDVALASGGTRTTQGYDSIGDEDFRHSGIDHSYRAGPGGETTVDALGHVA